MDINVIKDLDNGTYYLEKNFKDIYELADKLTDEELADFLSKYDDLYGLLEEIEHKDPSFKYTVQSLSGDFDSFKNYKGYKFSDKYVSNPTRVKDPYISTVQSYILHNDIQSEKEFNDKYRNDVNKFIADVKKNSNNKKEEPEMKENKTESFVDGRYAEDVYTEQIDNVLKNYPKDVTCLDDDQCFKYKDLYVELRPETTTDVNDVPEMDFVVFETEEDMNTDYEQNIGVDYYDISDANKYWQYVKDYCDAIIKSSNKELTESKNYNFSDLVTAAESLWGDEATVLDTNVEGIYDCHTPRHGGYLVDTTVFPELAKYGDKTPIDNIVGFEEDYEALKIIWLVPEVLNKTQLDNDFIKNLTIDQVTKYDNNDNFKNEFPTRRTLTESKELEYTLVTADQDKIKELEDHSAFTWEGMDISDENLKAIVEYFKKNTPTLKLPITFFTWKGKVFNDLYNLTGLNAYPEDLNFLSIDLDNWDSLGALPMIKFQVGARWLDDIVDNNARKQKYEESKLVEQVQDITWILKNYNGDVDICTKEQLGNDYSYRKLCTSVEDAEKFNYHSDYWGDEDTYQEDNVGLMEEVEPYVGKTVTVNFEGETKTFKVLGIAIDRQYNSLSHTVILVEEVKELDESTSDFEITMTDRIADNLGINKDEITETNGIIEFSYNGKTYKAEPISSCQVKILDEDGKEVSYGVVVDKIKEEVFTEYNKNDFIYQLVGGEYAGTYTREEAEKLPILEPKLSPDDSEVRNNGGFTHRKELDNQLQFKGYLGPMWNGTEDGKGVIRYETQEVYNMLSENKVEEHWEPTHLELDDEGYPILENPYKMSYSDNKECYYIKSIHPYDEADYSWAKTEDEDNTGTWLVYGPDNKLVTKVIGWEDAVEEMKKLDKDIKPIQAIY